jgi:hypothetical protein
MSCNTKFHFGDMVEGRRMMDKSSLARLDIEVQDAPLEGEQ